MTFIADLYPKLRAPKNVVRYLSKKSRFKGPFDRPKSPVSKDPLTGNMVNVLKHCFDLKHSTITIFSDHFEGN